MARGGRNAGSGAGSSAAAAAGGGGSAVAAAAAAGGGGGGGGSSPISAEARNAMEPQVLGPFKGCRLTLVNVTATANMKVPIDLKTVVMRARNAEYNPKRFSACVIRLNNPQEPKATALVFKTGKVVVTGSRSNASVDYACKTFARILSKLDGGSGGSASPKIRFDLETDRKVQNMVATTDVGFPIRLEGMVAAQSVKWCNYEPELFPGLIYRLNKPCKVCFLVFVSGKVVLTGAKSVKELEDAFKEVYPMLLRFRKATVLLQTSATPEPSPSEVSEPARKKSRASG